MNERPPTSRALVCRCARLSRAIFNDSFSRHVAGCSACQQATRAEEELESLLRADAARLPPINVTHLENAILSAVSTAPPPAPAARPAATWAWAGAALAAAAVVAVVFTFRPTEPIARTVAAAHVRSSAAPDVAPVAPSEVIRRVSVRLRDSVAPAAEFLKHDPLQQELENIQSDATSALRFLALNFLPSHAADAAAAEPGQI